MCIRARNMVVGCEGVVIPRRVMRHDLATVLVGIYNATAGDAAPLKIYTPEIEIAKMMHSTPGRRKTTPLQSP